VLTGLGRLRYLHKGSWAFKTFVWLVLLIVPFFMPEGGVTAYGAPSLALLAAPAHPLAAWVARLASGVFLVVQMVILLDFAYVWSESWVARGTNFWLGALMGCTAAAFGGGLALLGLGYRWFKPSGAGECTLNIFLLTLALLLGVAYSAAVLHPAVPHGSLLCSSVIFSYNAYLLVSALSSEPDKCNQSPFGANAGGAGGAAGAAGGMVLSLASVAYSAVRSGSSKAFSLRDEEEEEAAEAAALAEGGYAPLQEPVPELRPGELPPMRADGTAPAAPLPVQAAPPAPAPPPSRAAAAADGAEDEEVLAGGASRDVPYNYSFFHAIFALASCYTAMLLTEWGLTSKANAADKDTFGVGWASAWVKIGCTWVTSALYIWTLVAPTLFPDRFGGSAEEEDL